jgi:glycosyltransferase involved in cell wall biosynthesis
MRILWLTWKDITHPQAGGAEIMSSELAKRLVQDGHEVIFLAAAHGSDSPPQIVVIGGYQVIRVGTRYSVYWQAYRYVKQRLADWPDIVVEEVNTVPFFSSLYLKHKPRILLFYMLCRRIWFYQLPLPVSLVGYLLEPLYLRLLSRDPVIALSASTKLDLERHHFRPTRVSVMSAAIQLRPVDDLAVIRKYDKPTIVSLGSVRPMKQTLHQIHAFERAKSQIPDLQLKIAGEAGGGYGRKVLRALARSRYSADIEYLGTISDESKQTLLQRSHVIVVTSVKEGWGLIVTEAASQGTPAVVYDVDGLRDSVRDRETGLVTAPNPGALAAGLLMLLSNTQLYAQLRESAWRWSRELTFDNAYRTFAGIVQGRAREGAGSR